MRAVPARYHLLINSDAWLEEGALERLVAFADAHRDAAVVAPRVVNPDGTLQRSVRGFPTPFRVATEYFFLRKLAPRSHALNAYYAGDFRHDETRPVEWFMGSCFLVRREAADQVGLYDEDFFMFWEETDWFYRFHEAGWTIWFVHDAQEIHVGGATHGGRMYTENVRNLVRWFAKHRGSREAMRVRRLLIVALRLRGLVFPRRARAHVPRRRPRAVIRRVPWELLALPALGIARLLPETGVGLWARLFAATACLLLPGALVARALRAPGFSAAFAWALGALFAAMTVVFLVHSSLGLALVLLAVVAAVALVAVLKGQTPEGSVPREWLAPAAVALAGLIFGMALWSLTRHLTGGDDYFHLARVRKLLDFGGLSLRSVDEFRDGGLHPGYAFPLWHSFLALVAKLGGVDPERVVLREATVLVPAAFLVAWESGKAVFRSAWGGLAVLLVQVSMFALAAGSGGSYTALALPATLSRQVLVPAVIALFFAYVAKRSRAGIATLAVATLGLALVHPTYALFVLIPLAGYVAARTLLARTEILEGVAALAAVAAPAAAVALWLRPIAKETASVDPSKDELQRALVHYKGQLDVLADGELPARARALRPERRDRGDGALRRPARRLRRPPPLGGVRARRVPRRAPADARPDALHALRRRRLDLAGPARRRLRAVPLCDRGSGRRAGAAALRRRALRRARRGHRVPARLSRRLRLHARPGWPGGSRPGSRSSAAAPRSSSRSSCRAGSASSIGWGRSRRPRPRLAILPVALHGFTHWDEKPVRTPGLTSGLVHALRTEVPKKAVVFSDDTTSYSIAAFAPVYVANALPGHVADTKANHPYERRDDAAAFFRTGDLRIPRRYGATWVVVDRERYPKLRLDLRRAYQDGKYALYRG